MSNLEGGFLGSKTAKYMTFVCIIFGVILAIIAISSNRDNQTANLVIMTGVGLIIGCSIVLLINFAMAGDPSLQEKYVAIEPGNYKVVEKHMSFAHFDITYLVLLEHVETGKFYGVVFDVDVYATVQVGDIRKLGLKKSVSDDMSWYIIDEPEAEKEREQAE